MAGDAKGRKHQVAIASEVKVASLPSVAGMSVLLWLYWARIAIGHAESARAAADRRQEENLHLGYYNDEMTDSMIAVTGAAQCLDGILGSLESFDVKVRRIKPRSQLVLATLIHGFDVPHKQQAWARDFEWLFGLRNGAAHHRQRTRPPVSHPRTDEVFVSVEQADYSAESADEAVRIIEDVLRTLPTAGKPASEKWLEGHGVPIEFFLRDHEPHLPSPRPADAG